MTTNYLNMSYNELLADHALLHRATEAVMLQADLGYVQALEAIDDGFALASENASAPTLARALAEKNVDAGGFNQDLKILDAEANAAERKILDAEGLPEPPAGGVVENGAVLLASAEEGAELLHNPQVLETAYLKAVEAGDAEPGEEGRAEFVELCRVHAEAGLHHPRTLQHKRREREIEVRQMEADNRESAEIERQRLERHGRDPRSALGKQVDDYHDHLRRTGGPVQPVKPTVAFQHQVLNEADRAAATRARRKTEQPPKTRAPKLRRKKG